VQVGKLHACISSTECHINRKQEHRISFPIQRGTISVDMINKEEPSLERTLKGHNDAITAVSFSTYPSNSTMNNRHARQAPAGRGKRELLASGSEDGMITLWNFYRKEGLDDSVSRDNLPVKLRNSFSSSRDEPRAYRLNGHNGAITHCSFSKSGHLLASSSKDRTVRLWLPNAEGDNVVLKGHTGPVRCVNFSGGNYYNSSDGCTKSESPLLITCSDDKTVKIWKLPSKQFQVSIFLV